ncbi:toll/interleukin-1 receptor domain-containing protein [Alitiscatomonas aceti]|uniref:TIR domain-containing protein n=1 Tax=Alitiscatomonas aceti TaxID=2981724 RepID=A0ABT2V3H0_9FIRM|nr:SEFIR domain-containing protein [Alitiscatomonas aceti]MCU6801438.1 TIR domain-containing protein [Alitiscatomonas aceti]
MKNIIEFPKVFISYAWGTEDYQAKVLSFATDLMNDGIDVVLDRWSLKEGNDTYAFMEQSVTDSTITNVLILLDPNYEKKANTRDGGVGTETQIISPEVYNKVRQEKFLPVVFERGENGEIPKPQYLKTMLHFDLSQDEKYDLEYQRLVKRLYGIEIVEKPELGKKPSWIEEKSSITTKTRTRYEILKQQKSDNVKKDEFRNFLFAIKEKIVNFSKDKLGNSISAEEYIELYSETKVFRDDFLHLLKYSFYVPESYKAVASFMEEICGEIKNKNGYEGEVTKTLLHELFIYIVAFYFKNKDYGALSYTLSKTYFVGKYSYDDAQSFDVFYDNNENFDRAVSQRDGKNYYSGTASYWIDNINVEVCNKNEFVFADVFCYNASMFVENYTDGWFWFPITYIYSRMEYGNSLFRQFAVRLKSKEHLQEIAQIMGFSDAEAFKKKYIEIETKMKQGNFREYRYNSAFETAPVICQFIKAEELGIRN